MIRKNKILLAISITTIALIVALVGSVSAETTVILHDGDGKLQNPSCEELGYAYGYKSEGYGSGSETLSIGTISWTVTDEKFLAWTSTFGVDAVIMKGGDAANEYAYNPESFGDEDLVSPLNNGENIPQLSHVEFCYDYEVVVSKTVVPTFRRTYTWEIDKSVTPDEVDLFAGESAEFDYTVALDREYVDDNFAISGTISIYNPDPNYTATVESVVDNPGGGLADVYCPSWEIAPGGTLVCTYSAGPRETNTFASVNTATVTTSGLVGGGSDTEAIVFGTPTVIEGEETVNVTDENDLYGEQAFGPYSGDDSDDYSYSYACSSRPLRYTDGFYSYTVSNTATIFETDQFDSEIVTVNCYAPVVTKTANTFYDRTYKWAIDKSADQTELLLKPGAQFDVNYWIDVWMNGFTEDNFSASGIITVYNHNPSSVMTVSLADEFQGIPATLGCGDSLVVPAGGSATCSYFLTGLKKENGDNVATATLNDIKFSGSALVNFRTATVAEYDKCVEVTDDHFPGRTGTACLGEDRLPKRFSYTLTFGDNPEADVVLQCGENTDTNVASFETTDFKVAKATGSDSWTVEAELACDTGCTLTQGYWKTHSFAGPAPYDPTWALLPSGGNTPFFNSGQTWFDVFWTAPKGGNVYYILAHQYMAAKLNILGGADATDITTAIKDAENFFGSTDPIYTPTSIVAKRYVNTLKNAANTLDQYNNGLIGPGHCSEQ